MSDDDILRMLDAVRRYFKHVDESPLAADDMVDVIRRFEQLLYLESQVEHFIHEVDNG